MQGKKNFFFCIPFKPKSRCSDWSATVGLLGQTLRSLLNQTDPDFRVLIAGHDRPSLPELDDPRVSFHPVESLVPSREFPRAEGRQGGQAGSNAKDAFPGGDAERARRGIHT